VRNGEIKQLEAYLLGARPLGEYDKLLKFLSLEGHRFTAIAKGAQRSRKRFGGLLEPLTHLKLQLFCPRQYKTGENASFFRLENAEKVFFPKELRKNYYALEAAFFVLKLTSDLLPQEAHASPKIFSWLDRSLKTLNYFSFIREDASFYLYLRLLAWSELSELLGYSRIWPKEFTEQGLDMLSVEHSKDFIFEKELPAQALKLFYRDWLYHSQWNWKAFEGGRIA